MAVADEKFILTRTGFEHIQRQLEQLEAEEKRQREDLTDSLSESFGEDDNPDIGVEFESRTRKEWTDEQIGHLRYILERAELYDDPNPMCIDPGERVTLWDFDEKAEFQLDVLSSAEITTRANVGPDVRDVSTASPLGQALIGKCVGDVVEVEIPDGHLRYAIRKIEPIPEG